MPHDQTAPAGHRGTRSHHEMDQVGSASAMETATSRDQTRRSGTLRERRRTAMGPSPTPKVQPPKSIHTPANRRTRTAGRIRQVARMYRRRCRASRPSRTAACRPTGLGVPIVWEKLAVEPAGPELLTAASATPVAWVRTVTVPLAQARPCRQQAGSGAPPLLLHHAPPRGPSRGWEEAPPPKRQRYIGFS
jgi:hypothetical protein